MSVSAVAHKSEPVYLFWNGETLLDAAVPVAWPHVINYPSWQNYSIVQHVSGQPGHEGEVVLLKKEEGGGGFPPYYARTIRLQPPHRVTWKVFPQRPSTEGDFFGIVEFTLHDAQGKTRFCYDSLYEFLLPYDEGQVAAFRKQAEEATRAMFAAVLPRLNELVRQGT